MRAPTLAPPAVSTRAAFLATFRLEIAEAFRARWFAIYALVFFVLVGVLLVSGLTESRVLGFTGLSRTLVTYIQLTMAILPIFVLITTVRSLAGDREAGVFEYVLGLPIGIGPWYFGRFAGRCLLVAAPVVAALAAAVVYGLVRGVAVPWLELGFDLGLLMGMILAFVGIGFLVSALARSVDTAQTVAFLVWLSPSCWRSIWCCSVRSSGGGCRSRAWWRSPCSIRSRCSAPDRCCCSIRSWCSGRPPSPSSTSSDGPAS